MRREREMPHRSPPERPTAEDLTRLARAALAGSIDDRDRFLEACSQYAYDAARRLKRQHHGAEDSAQDTAMAVLRLFRAYPAELQPDTVGAFVRVVVLRSARATAERRAHEAGAAAQMVVAQWTTTGTGLRS